MSVTKIVPTVINVGWSADISIWMVDEKNEPLFHRGLVICDLKMELALNLTALLITFSFWLSLGYLFSALSASYTEVCLLTNLDCHGLTIPFSVVVCHRHTPTLYQQSDSDSIPFLWSTVFLTFSCFRSPYPGLQSGHVMCFTQRKKARCVAGRDWVCMGVFLRLRTTVPYYLYEFWLLLFCRPYLDKNARPSLSRLMTCANYFTWLFTQTCTPHNLSNHTQNSNPRRSRMPHWL
jgi:hypothetical protein